MNKDLKNLKNFTGGWLVGAFSPSLFSRSDIEVGVKHLKKGFIDKAHYHKKYVEYNMIIEGKLLLEDGQIAKPNDIFVYEPLEVSCCEALTDCVVLVIRDGSDPNDKYYA